MAYAVEVTLGRGNKVSLNYQSEEVSVSITYKLERGDADVLEVVKAKTPELSETHRLAWEGVKQAKSPQTIAPVTEDPLSVASQATALQELPVEESTSSPASDEVDLQGKCLDEPLPETGDILPGEESLEVTQTPITGAQVQVVRVLCQSLMIDAIALEERLSTCAGCQTLESLTHTQAAALIVELSRERRQQLDQERSGSG